VAQQIDPAHPRTLSTFVPLSRKAASMVAVIVRPLFGGILHVVRRHGGDCKKMRRQKAVVCASTGAMAGWLACFFSSKVMPCAEKSTHRDLLACLAGPLTTDHSTKTPC